MPFYGNLPTETRVSDSGAEYTVKVDPKAEAKNKATAQPGPVTSETVKGETPAKPEGTAKGK